MTYSLTVKMPDAPHTLTVYSDGENLTAIVFDCKDTDKPDDICLTAAKQLEEYFAGKRKTFSVPYTLYGGEFFKAVMRAAALIPYGHTATYGDVAASAGYNNAARAVGNALSKNPLPIIIPCHRILPKSGGIGNYFGGKLNDIKEYLLKTEGII